jgi:glycosyltransferase involved in cell wall biosynthesis
MKYIITTHNKVDYIEQVIESLINSGNKGDILVIQDHCTDGTDKIITELQKKYNFLFTIKTPDVYELKSINIGLDYFGDNDDIMTIQDDIFIRENISEKYYKLFENVPCIGLVSPRMGVDLNISSFYNRLTSILRKNYLLKKYVFINNIYIREDEKETFPGATCVIDKYQEVFSSVGSPLIFSKNFLKHCGLLNDYMQPFSWFDIEAGIRARILGYRNFIMPSKFDSPIELGTSRKVWVENKKKMKWADKIDLYNRIYIAEKYSSEINRKNVNTKL